MAYKFIAGAVSAAVGVSAFYYTAKMASECVKVTCDIEQEIIKDPR